MDYATHVWSSTMLNYFQEKCKGLASSGVSVFLNADEDEGLHRLLRIGRAHLHIGDD